LIIIWGTKPFQKILGHLQACNCGNCNNVVPFRVIRIWTWFTLFWIPLFPIFTSYVITCPICSCGTKVKKTIALSELEKATTSTYQVQSAESRLIGAICPGCKQNLCENDDIVVCPVCGIRCHRGCYTGVCLTNAQQMSKYCKL